MEMQKIAVTGGTGFLGAAVARACADAGYDVATCSLSTGTDLRHPDASAAFFCKHQPDVVLHCAAHVGGAGYVAEHAIDVFEDNLRIGLGLMHGLRVAGVRTLVTVMPSTTYAATQAAAREADWWTGTTPDHATVPTLPHKTLWGLCHAHGIITGLRSGHLILPSLYGPGDHFDPLRSHALGTLVATMADAHVEGETCLKLGGTAPPAGEWMYVTDAAGAVVAFLKAIAADDTVVAHHPVFNVAAREHTSLLELAARVREIVGWEGKLVFEGAAPDERGAQRLDGARFCALTGFEPEVDLRTGIQRTVAWYQTQVQRAFATTS